VICASPVLPGLARRGAGCTGPGCSVSPQPEGRKTFHRCTGRGHRPCHSATLTLGEPGAKAPGQRPSRPWRALRTRRAGRWPAVVRVAPVLVGLPRAGGGNAVRFRFPPPTGSGGSPLHWQGPSPLPQRHADPWPAGGQSPRPAPVPPMAGASHPPGRALASVGAGGTGPGGNVPRGRGKRGAFPVPARPKTLFPPGSVLGHFGEPVLARRCRFRRRAECIITEPVRGIAVAPDMPGGLKAAPDLGPILDSARNGVTV